MIDEIKADVEMSEQLEKTHVIRKPFENVEGNSDIKDEFLDKSASSAVEVLIDEC